MPFNGSMVRHSQRPERIEGLSKSVRQSLFITPASFGGEGDDGDARSTMRDTNRQTIRRSQISVFEAYNWSSFGSEDFLTERSTNSYVAGVQWIQREAGAIARSRIFETIVAIVISVNGLTIGLGIHLTTQAADFSAPAWIEQLEYIFLAFYMFEVGLYFVAKGFSAFKQTRMFVDCFFVVVGLVGVVGELILSDPKDDGDVGWLMTLRMMRILRLVRPLRIVVKFKPLVLLVSGFMGSTRTVLWIFFLLVATLYGAACMGVELIWKSAYGPTADKRLAETDEYVAMIDAKFNSLPLMMLSLLQFLNMETTAEMYWPLTSNNPVLVIYFCALICLLPVCLMNVITGVVVEMALYNSGQDLDIARSFREHRKAEQVTRLHELFVELDTDHTGSVDLKELKGASPHALQLLRELVEVEQPSEIFSMLNLNPDETMRRDELCERVLHVANYVGPSAMLRIEQEVESLAERLLRLEHRMSELVNQVAARNDLDIGMSKTISQSTATLASRRATTISRPTVRNSVHTVAGEHAPLDVNSQNLWLANIVKNVAIGCSEDSGSASGDSCLDAIPLVAEKKLQEGAASPECIGDSSDDTTITPLPERRNTKSGLRRGSRSSKGSKKQWSRESLETVSEEHPSPIHSMKHTRPLAIGRCQVSDAPNPQDPTP
eukprot:TRINITY_DN67472_c0_g1_i1.p1 TRINITY_DN67472_c0_g1~~TRINITY_DN67472_c0_g1_i1.p1  ORF type:complete len:663 (+),score=138.58 TRINITY_DN67472_c0_g1_i1:137-2125(+)